MATTKTENHRNDRGVLPNVANLALDVVDRGQSTAIAVLQDARTELRTAVESGIEFAEKTASSAFRFARKLSQRVDEGVAETLTNVERMIGGAVKQARETTRSAAELAHTAASGLTGSTNAQA